MPTPHAHRRLAVYTFQEQKALQHLESLRLHGHDLTTRRTDVRVNCHPLVCLTISSSARVLDASPRSCSLALLAFTLPYTRALHSCLHLILISIQLSPLGFLEVSLDSRLKLRHLPHLSFRTSVHVTTPRICI